MYLSNKEIQFFINSDLSILNLSNNPDQSGSHPPLDNLFNFIHNSFNLFAFPFIFH